MQIQSVLRRFRAFGADSEGFDVYSERFDAIQDVPVVFKVVLLRFNTKFSA